MWKQSPVVNESDFNIINLIILNCEIIIKFNQHYKPSAPQLYGLCIHLTQVRQSLPEKVSNLMPNKPNKKTNKIEGDSFCQTVSQDNTIIITPWNQKCNPLLPTHTARIDQKVSLLPSKESV